jgi:4-amino-4-deoxy-L-arabinose transferase-like glycosyltransferase
VRQVSPLTQIKSSVIILDIVAIAAISFFLYYLFLDHYPLINPDETRYSEISREMLFFHQWITPKLNGIPFLDKPPLFYWLQAACIHLFGLSNASLRLWPVIAGATGTTISYLFTCTLYKRRAGLLCASILATCWFYFAMSHFANMDLSVSVFISAALCCYYLANRDGQINLPLLYLGYLFCALAILTKGFIGIVLPAIVIITYLAITKQWQQIKKMRLITGLLLIFVIVLPWFYYVSANNKGFWHYFFYVQHIHRYLSSNFNGHEPIYFYVVILFIGSFPWSIVMLDSILCAIKNSRLKLKNNDEIFLLCWLFAIIIFYSLPQSKLAGYILPVFFPLSILLAMHFNQYWSRADKWSSVNFIKWTQLLLYIILLASLCVFTLLKSPSLTYQMHTVLLHGIIMISILVIGQVLVIKTNTTSVFFYSLFFSGIAINILCVYILASNPNLFDPHPVAPLINKLKTFYKPKDKIISFETFIKEVPLKMKTIITLAYNPNDPRISQTDNWKREFSQGLNQSKYHKQILTNIRFHQLWHSNLRVFVLIRESIKTFILHAKVHPYILGQSSNISLLTNHPLSKYP